MQQNSGSDNTTVLIAASEKDPASLNIAEQILKNYPFSLAMEKFQGAPVYSYKVKDRNIALTILDYELVYAQNITEFSPHPELVVFVSRHSSASGTPTLSVHTPGNFGEAELGGMPRKVSVSPAAAMVTALKTMAKILSEKKLAYKVSYECTHHGPSLDIPAMFVELGSTPREWGNKEAAEVVAHAAMEAALDFKGYKAKAVIGIGGPHYNEKFTRMALEETIAFGHMKPKYAVESVDEHILRQCIERTLEGVEFAVLDWKGIRGKDKKRIIEMLERINLQFKKV